MATITIADRAFDGPYTYASLLTRAAGVWAVLDGRELPPVDAGEADENLREAVETSDRYDCWRDRCNRITYAGMAIPDPDLRSKVLERLEKRYALPCRPE